MNFFSEVTSIREILNDEKSVELLKRFDIIREEELTLINQLIPELENIYPERWDIQIKFKKINRVIISIVIYYPEIIVENGTDKHTIHDIYVSFPIISELHIIKLSVINGTRTRVSYAEFLTGYMHSHLETSSFKTIEYGKFCLGEGEICQTMMLYNSSKEIEFFKLFLMQLESYLSWESLEGGPHITMSKVFKRGVSNSIPIITLYTVYNVFIRYLSNINYKNLNNLSFDLSVKGIISIIDNENFEDYCLNITSGYISSSYKCFKVDGQYSGSIADINKLKNLTKDTIVFRNKQIGFTLDYEIPDIKGKEYVHPTIKKVIKHKIEYELNKQKIKLNSFK
jgi:hypothetical protein